jgi:hypothetical protein
VNVTFLIATTTTQKERSHKVLSYQLHL